MITFCAIDMIQEINRILDYTIANIAVVPVSIIRLQELQFLYLIFHIKETF